MHFAITLQKEVRRVYGILCEEDEDFGGWKTGPGYDFKIYIITVSYSECYFVE